MVRWRGRRGSDNVEDRRGATAAGGAGLILLLLRLVFSRFGIGGVVVLVGGFFALRAVGIDPLALLQGQPATGPSVARGQDDESAQFVRVVLAETETVWTEKFAERGARYAPPILVLFSGQVNSACGMASAASGPFYCPADRKVYLDTSFFSELSARFGAPGDFAAAYVIAHEVGHHVQTLAGVADQVRRAQARADEAERNALQVRMELQADCYAGLWAKGAARMTDFIEQGDIEEGLRAASAIGDDALQRQAGRTVRPESFTHGSSEQRVSWFSRGYESGAVEACDSFPN
jgi:predicted metalloprotease